MVDRTCLVSAWRNVEAKALGDLLHNSELVQCNAVGGERMLTHGRIIAEITATRQHQHQQLHSDGVDKSSLANFQEISRMNF